MNKVANYRLPCSYKGTEGPAKCTIKATSDERPSFLCFLSDYHCVAANMLLTNGMAESSGTGNYFRNTHSTSLESKIYPQEAFDVTNQFSDVSVEAERQSSYSLFQNKSVSVDHDLNSPAAGLGLQNLEVSDSENGEITECNVPDGLCDRSSGELDIPAFEITEFFNSFQGRQEQNVGNRKQMRDLLPPEILMELEGTGSSPLILDQHRKSDKVVPRVIVNPMEGRASPSAGQSGKWNCFSEPDTFSANLSGPLTFSGPMSLSGNSGGVPCSGSLSHRSDSSSASTHSFAFPILPYEWNSSPVRMSQPDKRFMRRPWKRRLRSVLCCANSFK